MGVIRHHSASMDINQATDFYLANFKGFNLESGVPSLEKQQIAMQTVIELAKQSEPVGGKLGHLDEIVGITAALAPKSAELFNKAIVDNPEQKGSGEIAGAGTFHRREALATNLAAHQEPYRADDAAL